MNFLFINVVTVKDIYLYLPESDIIFHIKIKGQKTNSQGAEMKFKAQFFLFHEEVRGSPRGGEKTEPTCQNRSFDKCDVLLQMKEPPHFVFRIWF